MNAAGFEIVADGLVQGTSPGMAMPPLVQAVLAVLRHRHPDTCLEAWCDCSRDRRWQFTLEGWCRVEVRGESIFLSEPITDAGLEDDLPMIPNWIEVRSLEELEARLP